MTRGLFTILAFLTVTSPVWADVAEEDCTPQPLTEEQRTAMSDVVFEGEVTHASCECHPLASDSDKDGPEVFCTDVIKVTKPIKGQTASEFTVKSSVMVSHHYDKTLWHFQCKSRVNDRNDALVGKEDTFYMHLVDGFYQTVPESVCR